ncbi:MAG: peptidylprolyl isomerase [Deltaproteobacteria bacterium]|nr:peptidylprolyl isomerase [Deltaproteobacteria bacterium]
MLSTRTRTPVAAAVGCFSLIATFLLCTLVAGAVQSAEQDAPERFASVNGVELSLERYAQALEGTARGTFYHGRPPDGDFEKYRYDVGQRLIEGELLDQEALRRGIGSDPESVETSLDSLKERYGDEPEWKEREAKIVSQLREYLAAQNRVQKLEEQIRQIPEPTDAQLRAYYLENAEQFTSPERLHVSMILLRVDASAARATWEAARDEAIRLDEKLRGGADFAELARLHSQDPSADQGGDLGFVHRGMIGAFVQTAVDELAPGELSGPVQLLEGIGLFRLEARQAGELNDLDAVRDRASALWLREAKDRAREDLLEKLRASAQLEIFDPDYIELAAKRADEAANRRAEGEEHSSPE